jgi:hypothetical protein
VLQHTLPLVMPHEPLSNVKHKHALDAACLVTPVNLVFPDVTANQVLPANPDALAAPVAHQSSATSQSFHHAVNAHPAHQDHLAPTEIPATPDVPDNPADLATPETPAHLDHKDHPDHLEIPAAMALVETLAVPLSPLPTFPETPDSLAMLDLPVFLVTPAHPDVMASLATKDHLDLPDHLESPEPTANQDPKDHPDSLVHKENVVSVRNTALWTVVSSLKMALVASKSINIMRMGDGLREDLLFRFDSFTFF